MPAEAVREFRKELMKLPDYWQLTDRTRNLMRQLPNVTLINLLRWFSMIGEDKESPLFLDACGELHERGDKLSIAELVEALFVMHFHIEGALNDRQLLTTARTMVMDSKKIDHQDIETMMKCIFLFLMPGYDEGYKASRRLINLLLQRKVQLDFRQSVMLLRRVKQSHSIKSKEVRKSHQEKNFRKTFNQEGRLQIRLNPTIIRHFPSELTHLIDKCNAVIHRELTERPTEENFDFFLSRLHDFVDAVNHEFDNFYSLNLLKPVRDFLLSREPATAKRYDRVLYNLTKNYYKMTTFDEELLRRVYEAICNKEEMRNEVDPTSFYYMMAKYRLPFVDHELLADRLFGELPVEEIVTSVPRLLSELILNDVKNEHVLGRVCDAIRNISSHYVSSNEYKKVALARAYFSMFGQLESVELKEKISRKLNTIIYDYAGNKPSLSKKYIRHGDSKLQKNGFLSNGMYVKGFGVYDWQQGDFISLADQDQYFFKIDRMPLRKNQEL